MFCKNCGAPINDHLKFCGRCGAPIDSHLSVHTFAERLPFSKSDNTVPNTNNSNKSNIIIALLIIAITIIAFTSLVLILKSPNDDTTSSYTYLSAEERVVLGTWYTYGISTDSVFFAPLTKNVGTINFYDDFTGNISVSNLSYTFTWECADLSYGIYKYCLYLNNGKTAVGTYSTDIDVICFKDSNNIFYYFQR